MKKIVQNHINNASFPSVVVATQVAGRCSVFTSREMAVSATHSLKAPLVTQPPLILHYYSCLHLQHKNTAISQSPYLYSVLASKHVILPPSTASSPFLILMFMQPIRLPSLSCSSYKTSLLDRY